jgi:predicted RecA/RadA family phage recombinase
MIAIYKQSEDTVDYAPAADVAAGDVVVQGELVGVASREIKAGALGALTVSGVFDFPKATGAGTAITAGARVFWDAAAKVATTSDGGGANKFLGKSVLAAADGDATVSARLSQ